MTAYNNTKRIVFSFDERNYNNLERIRYRGNFSSYADVVRESLQVSNILQEQNDEGFSEIVVRSPKTGKERIMSIPSLTRG